MRIKNRYKVEKTEEEILAEKITAQRNLFIKSVGMIALCVGIVGYHYITKAINFRSAKGNDSTAIEESNRNQSPENVDNSSVRIIGTITSDLPKANFYVSNDGSWLIAINDTEAVSYDVLSVKKTELKTSAPGYFPKVCFINKSEAAISGENGIDILSLRTGEKRLSINVAGGIEAFAASDDEILLAGITRHDGTIKIWDTRDGKLLGSAPGNPNSLRPSIIFKGPEKLSIYEISESRSRILDIAIPSMKESATKWQEFGETNIEFADGGRLLAGESLDRDAENPELLIFDGENAAFAGKLSLINSGGRIINNMRAVLINDDGVVSLIRLQDKSEPENGTILMKTKSGSKIASVSESGNSIVLVKNSSEAVVIHVR